MGELFRGGGSQSESNSSALRYTNFPEPSLPGDQPPFFLDQGSPEWFIKNAEFFRRVLADGFLAGPSEALMNLWRGIAGLAVAIAKDTNVALESKR